VPDFCLDTHTSTICYPSLTIQLRCCSSIHNTMESDEPGAGQSQRDRRRSSSPPDSRLGAAAEPTIRTNRRARWRSPRGVQEILDEMEAEGKPRRNLPPAERLEEAGQNFLRQLERNDRMVFLLQETPPRHPGRAQCQAEDCLYVHAEKANGRYITDDHRICVDRGTSYDGKSYYHVLCLECMIDLEELVPSKFKMAGTPGRWSLMFRKWFEHKGCINLDKIAAYLEEREAFKEKLGEFSRE